ncbi:pantoate--beta-alanine ligase [Algoriphagus sp. CAU 1675]|nr:pantoate--beta-alanine ligase [Algoriphagus sp. CAU 1675]MDF2156642.1 pantoate--beta-alanine ligase [Algoriphagus sp. CAU 1675]
MHTGAEWQKIWLQLLQSNKTIGLVPTMGALHQGHLDLVKKCKKQCEVSVVSIFVNPTQFNNPEDFEKYPISTAADVDLLEKEGVDFVFLPSVETMYPTQPQLKVDFGRLEKILEGAFRPGHFNGVGIVVSKLFNIIRPHVAFFGQKDLQQVAVIRSLVQDLSFPVQLETVSTRRESDGLAMSSRNRRLSPLQREKALLLFQSLMLAKEELLKGKSWKSIQEKIRVNFQHTEAVQLEYVELVQTESFDLLEAWLPNLNCSVCIAAFIGEVRLIDNMPINS